MLGVAGMRMTGVVINSAVLVVRINRVFDVIDCVTYRIFGLAKYVLGCALGFVLMALIFQVTISG